MRGGRYFYVLTENEHGPAVLQSVVVECPRLQPAWRLGPLPAYQEEDWPALSEVLPAGPVTLVPFSAANSNHAGSISKVIQPHISHVEMVQFLLEPLLLCWRDHGISRNAGQGKSV